jgi:hypothetical protein
MIEFLGIVLGVVVCALVVLLGLGAVMIVIDDIRRRRNR